MCDIHIYYTVHETSLIQHAHNGPGPETIARVDYMQIYARLSDYRETSGIYMVTVHTSKLSDYR